VLIAFSSYGRKLKNEKLLKNNGEKRTNEYVMEKIGRSKVS